MVYSIRDIVSSLETLAPPAYQEPYDNAQLITGNPEDMVSGIICSLDVSEEVVQEAIDKKCNLIVAHHPILFKGIKSLTGKNYVERTLIKAIKNDIAIFAIHTNLDHVDKGVNKKLCDKIGLIRTRILDPKPSMLMKLVTFVPLAHADQVLQSLYGAGAGKIGNYSACSFQVNGTGSFMPSENANPTLGQRGLLEKVEEKRIEIIFPAHLKNRVLSELKKSHP